VTQTLLPPILRPPHDPTSLLCDARLGWWVLDSDHVAVDRGSLTLERAPGSLRWFTEPSGSFGGLRAPANVALCDDAIWLLDPSGPALKRFDPCECRFDEVPCFDAAGSGPREVFDPRGIAAFGDRLFVCDAGNARLGVFVLPALALSGHWTAPFTWMPTGAAIDRRGTVFVADPLNGMVHRFSPHGTYLGNWTGFGASTHITVGRDGTVYVAGPVDAFRVGADGQPVPVTNPADDLADAFPPIRFAVDDLGRMHLGTLCTPPSTLMFDAHGDAVTQADAAPLDRYERAGIALLGPFDSLMDKCTWHRVIVRGELPHSSRAAISTYTSEIPLPPSEVSHLPENAWESHLQCDSLDTGEWDGLIRSIPGRHLWLRVELRGNGRSGPRFDSLEIEFPRISLRRFMPAVYGAEPRSADFTDRLLALFDRSLRETELTIDNIAALFDPISTPDLDWLASWIGIELDNQIPESLQRTLVKRWAESAALRGTRFGMWQVLVTYLGLDSLRMRCSCSVKYSCRQPAPTCPPAPLPKTVWDPPPLILEHYQLRRWLALGVGRLGDQAVLWGKRIVNRSQLGDGTQVGVTQLKATQDPLRDPFHVYAHRFSVFVPASAGRTPERRRALERLIARERPGHTHGTIEYVEPRFRIGFQSMIGLDSVVACLPQAPVTLGETTLGAVSSLGGSQKSRQVLDSSRIGTTAVLE
jgi:phage tail-like protein